MLLLLHTSILSLALTPTPRLVGQPTTMPRHPIVVGQAIRESRVAPITEVSPGARYRAMKEAGIKFYEGRKKDTLKNLKEGLKNAGKRKVVVITGASSGLGLYCVEAIVDAAKEGYFVVCAVRDPDKMIEAADAAGIDRKDYTATELQLASLQSVRDFADDIRKALPGGRLDRLVCNAAPPTPSRASPTTTSRCHCRSITSATFFWCSYYCRL